MVQLIRYPQMQTTVQTPPYKYLINSASDGKVQLTAIDNCTAEVFQSEWVQLQQISIATISAAIRKENSHIEYKLQRMAKQIILTICVDFDFLPKIHEQILLYEIEKKQSLAKIQMAQFTEQLAKLESELLHVGCKNFQLASEIALPLVRTIPAGRSVIEFSGLMTQDYCYHDDLGEEGYMEGMPATIVVEAFEGEESNEIKLKELSYPIYFSQYSGYESPFKITFLVELKKKGKISIKVSEMVVSLQNSVFTIATL